MNLVINYKSDGDIQNLETNFEDLKRVVAVEIKKYSIDVTEDNIQEAKSTMAKMNKVKGEIGNQYKQYIDKLSSPIVKLKSEKKELEGIITQGRQEIADAVSVFEQKRLDVARDEIFKYLSDVCIEKGIDWKSVSVNDLIKLGAITTKGNLVKATKEAINSRVSLVVNEILRAKLEAEEKAKRDKEIADKAIEEERKKSEEREARLKVENEERERRLLAQAEIDKKNAVNEAKVEIRKEVVKEQLPENMTMIEKVAPREVEDKIVYTVLATFEVPVPKHITKEQVKNAVNKKLIEAGVTTLKNVEVM